MDADLHGVDLNPGMLEVARIALGPEGPNDRLGEGWSIVSLKGDLGAILFTAGEAPLLLAACRQRP
jgi:hypothetical protein